MERSEVRVSEAGLEEIAGRLVAATAPRALYLFGSHVYGTPTADSDVDILVVLPADSVSTWNAAERAYAAIRGVSLPVELHFTSPKRFALRSAVPGSFEREVASRGRLIYGLDPRTDGVSDADRAAAKSEIVREWLAKARSELQTARVALEAPQPLAGIACFHCRQAAEQSLKALLQWHETEAGSARDFAALADLCSPFEPQIAGLRAAVGVLATYDEALLYPGARDPSSEEARHALAAASELHACVLEYLRREKCL